MEEIPEIFNLKVFINGKNYSDYGYIDTIENDEILYDIKNIDFVNRTVTIDTSGLKFQTDKETYSFDEVDFFKYTEFIRSIENRKIIEGQIGFYRDMFGQVFYDSDIGFFFMNLDEDDSNVYNIEKGGFFKVGFCKTFNSDEFDTERYISEYEKCLEDLENSDEEIS